MKFLSWAICVLGLTMLVGGFLGAMNWVNIVGGLIIAVLALIGAIKG
jgi:hypothetical protein